MQRYSFEVKRVSEAHLRTSFVRFLMLIFLLLLLARENEFEGWRFEYSNLCYYSHKWFYFAMKSDIEFDFCQ